MRRSMMLRHQITVRRRQVAQPKPGLGRPGGPSCGRARHLRVPLVRAASGWWTFGGACGVPEVCPACELQRCATVQR